MASPSDLQRAATFSVFTRFRAFWRQVEAVKAEVTSGTVAAPTPQAPGLVHVATTARLKLLAALRQQETELARWTDGPALEYYREAQYVMAAAADEVFVRLPWSGATYWTWNLLETELFGSRSAGQLVFDRIDRLIAGTDPNTRELAAVYLTALALGFEGKYAGLSDRRAIDHYKRQLRQFLFGEGNSLVGPLVPQCYESTSVVGSGKRLGSARAWWWVAAAVVGIWLVVSSLLWYQLTNPIVTAANQANITPRGSTR